jgi:hypothetical protein
MHTKLLRSISKFFVNRNPKAIRNIGFTRSQNKPHALLSIVLEPFAYDISDATSWHPMALKAIELSTIILDLDFVLDIYDHRFKGPFEHQYDLVLGFGDAYRNSLINSSGNRILFLCENEPTFSQQQENLRREYLLSRHSLNWPVERSAKFYTQSDIQCSTGVLCCGNLIADKVKKMYNKKALSVRVPGIAHNNSTAFYRQSNQVLHLLWFGSQGIIHKGLDLCIDAISNDKRFHLHVCGVSKKSLPSFIRSTSNATFYGFIDVNGRDFSYLVSICSHSLLLSASEGIPTSLLTTMLSGLIPIVSDNFGISMPSFSVTIDEQSMSVDAIRRALISEYNLLDHIDVPARRQQISHWVQRHYPSDCFAVDLRNALPGILL